MSEKEKTEKKAASKSKETDSKKSKKSDSKKKSLFARIAQWFKDLKKEFKRVVWPTKEAVFKNSLVVLSVVILGSAVVGLLDTGFLKLMKFLMELSK